MLIAYRGVMSIPVCVLPQNDPHIDDAVTSADGELVDLDQARVLAWLGGPDGFPELPDAVEWVALPSAGIEGFMRAGVIDDKRIWTNASGFYADNVAEHALALLLAGLRQIHTAARTRWDKKRIDTSVRSLHGSTVMVLGAGGIGKALIPRLSACGATALAVNHSGRHVDGAQETVTWKDLADVWARVDHVVIAAPATEETHHILDADALAALPDHAWIVNIARGTLIDQPALIDALRAGTIAGAALDVTDPEPPADDDPLFSLDNVIVTPHVANPSSTLTENLAPWIAENLRRFAGREQLLSVVEPGSAY
ncbi:D-isomer specific 2-hydroxyacid dehydrogenase family protein [Gordonia jinhuaensis]|uniref:Dihydrofolate reductase n=2 Tax=Gordonia jinhuaensis TaxID=1517702 RepID=A0A916WUB9_9ACTN|nr:dihydrofolate reductase [Gordonia jinhuaensis]